MLDLDETLVHSSFKVRPHHIFLFVSIMTIPTYLQAIQQADYVVPVEIDHHWHNFYVLKRPGVDDFLREMGLIYEVVVFTASLSVVSFEIYTVTFRYLTNIQYADPVLDKLDVHRAVSHRLFRESCYNHKGNYVKVRHAHA